MELMDFRTSSDAALVAVAGLAVVLGYWVWSAVRLALSSRR
jgi:hypothetical protein